MTNVKHLIVGTVFIGMGIASSSANSVNPYRTIGQDYPEILVHTQKDKKPISGAVLITDWYATLNRVIKTNHKTKKSEIVELQLLPSGYGDSGLLFEEVYTVTVNCTNPRASFAKTYLPDRKFSLKDAMSYESNTPHIERKAVEGIFKAYCL